jgi:hypothetical protein
MVPGDGLQGAHPLNFRSTGIAFSALLALSLLAGFPAHAVAGVTTASAEWNGGFGAAPVASPSLGEEPGDGGLNRRTDDQDEPDRVVRVGAPISWPEPTSAPCCRFTGLGATRTHRACAAPPRGPPPV